MLFMRARKPLTFALLLAITAGGVFYAATQSWGETDTVTVAVEAPSLNPLVDRAVPANLLPSLAQAKLDRPKPYKDRCHTQQDLEKSSSPCEYGNLQSPTSIVLFGDSHALSWFPALERLAIKKNWKLVSLTMSSCWPSDIPAWNSTTNKLMSNCSIWRTDTLNDIVKMKPEMIFVTGTRGFTTVDKKNKVLLGDQRTKAWEDGMLRTIDKLKKASSKVVLLSDTPISSFDAPICLQESSQSIERCATPYGKSVSLIWLTEEKHVAEKEGITWVNPTPWICATEPCSPLSGRYEIFVDKGHLTASFAWTLEKPLWTLLSSES